MRLSRALQHEESKSLSVTSGNKLDEAHIDGQIGRVFAARGELTKANAHKLPQIRDQMTLEKTEKLEEHRPQLPPGEN